MSSMVLACVYLIVLLLSILLTFAISVIWLILKPPAKNVCGNALIVVASICALIGMLSQPVSDYIQSRHEMNVRQYLRDEGAILASKADAIANSMEKAESAELIKTELPISQALVQFLALPTKEEASAAVRAFFDKLSSADRHLIKILDRHIIFEHEVGLPLSDKISKVDSRVNEDDQNFTEFIQNVNKPIPAGEVDEHASMAIKTLPDGFYRYSLLKAIYKSAGDAGHLKALTSQHQVRVRARMHRMIAGIGLSYMFILVGIIVLFMLVKGHKQASFNEFEGEPIPAISFKRVYCFALVVYFTQFCLSFPFGLLAAMLPQFASLIRVEAMPLTTITLAANMVVIFLCARWVIFKPLGLRTVPLLKTLFRGNLFRAIKLGAASFCAVKALVALFYWVIHAIFQTESSTNNPIVDQIRIIALEPSALSLLFITMSIALFAPLAEEFAFRALLYTSIKPRAGMVGAIFISGAIFAVYHMDPGAFCGLFCVGVGLAYLFERSKSLLPCVMMHAMWNSTFILLAWLLT